jgi:hypothetical protein
MKSEYRFLFGAILVGLLAWMASRSDIINADPLPPPSDKSALVLPPETVSAPHAKKATQDVDALLDALEDVRAKKAELERQEQMLIQEIKEKLQLQRQRLQKLGITDDERPGQIAIPKMPKIEPFWPKELPKRPKIDPIGPKRPPTIGVN